jgi:hypothetical protein
MSPDKVVRAENKDKLQAMKDYATNTIMCRRKMILEYFEEQYDPFNCGNCDNCMAILNNSNHSMQDFTEDVLLMLKSIKVTGERYGLTVPIQLLLGKKDNRLISNDDVNGVSGKGKIRSEKWWKELAMVMKNYKLIEETSSQFYVTYRLSPKGALIVSNPAAYSPILLPATKVMASEEIAAEKKARLEELRNPQHKFKKMDEETVMLFRELFKLRKEQAQQRKIAPYMIFSEMVLGLLAKHRPTDATHFSLIEGIDEQKSKDYGAAFTKAIAEFCQVHKLETNVFDNNVLDKSEHRKVLLQSSMQPLKKSASKIRGQGAVMNPSVRRSNQIVSDDDVEDDDAIADAMMNEIEEPVKNAVQETKVQEMEVTQAPSDYDVVQLDNNEETSQKRGLKRKLPSWSQPRAYGGLPLTNSHKKTAPTDTQHDGTGNNNVVSSQVLFSLPQQSAASSGRVTMTRTNYKPEEAIDIDEPPAKRARVDPTVSGADNDVLIRTSILGQYMFNCKEMSPLELYAYFEEQRQ